MRSRTLRWTVLLAAVSAVSFAQDPNGERQPIQSPIVRAVNAAGPAVVNISTEKIVATQTPDPMRRQLFDEDRLDEYFDRFQQMNVRKRSLGSGVLFDPRGYIVTNEHVVHRASKIEVTLKDRSTYSGRLISTDHTRDLAVI
ncbi:MAG TPA: trypsin-like peptidase domain-containing protein, partial [Planctomycetota bacterium]|nr:trypsin-like peptidase domain-containing protein [Planctomycetota bacterium]